jgi:predicted dehydrogenase
MSVAQAGSFGWGILGTGAIAQLFAADLALLSEARLAAVASRSAGTAQTFAERFGAATAYHDLDAFLADPAIDAVYVATPNNLHAEQALRAIAAGKPVLIEKPIALSSADVEAIARAAGERKLFAMEAMWTRFLPAIAALRRHLAAGAIGQIQRIRADLSYVQAETPQSRFFDPALGGGAAFDLGVYPVSLALHLLGAPERVTGRWQAAASGVDRRSEIALHYPQAVAELSCGFDCNGANRFLIEGSAGAIRLEAPFLKVQRLTLYSAQASANPLLSPHRDGTGLLTKLADRLPFSGRRAEHHGFPGNGLQFQAQAVMDAIRAGTTGSALMPLAESAAVLRVLEAVLAQPPVKPA